MLAALFMVAVGPVIDQLSPCCLVGQTVAKGDLTS
jgi:hypothetical protein